MNVSYYGAGVEAKEGDAVGSMREMDSPMLTTDQRELVANATVTRGTAPGLRLIQYLGYVCFYNTGINLNNWNSSGTSLLDVIYTNAMSPWNILSMDRLRIKLIRILTIQYGGNYEYNRCN